MATPSSGTISAANIRTEYFNSYGGEVNFQRIGWLTNASGGSVNSNFAMNEMYNQSLDPVTSGMLHHSDIVNPASGQGGSTLYDLSGNGNTATATTGFITDYSWGYPPYAYFMVWNFEGYGNIPIQLNTNFTIEAWVRPYPGYYNGADYYYCGQYDAVVRYMVQPFVSPTNFGGDVSSGAVGWGFVLNSWGTWSTKGGNDFAPSNLGVAYSFSSSQFQQIVWSCSGTTDYLWINGSLIASGNCWGGGHTNYLRMYNNHMFTNPDVGNQSYIGMWQGTRVYNRKLSNSEVLTLYNNQRGRYGI